MITLRPYQNDALAGLDNYWLRGAGRNPIISAPTGSGKSLLIAEFVRRTLAEYQNLRVMVLVDSRELVRQNAEELRAIWPEAPVGVYSAGLKRRQKNAQITFAGIQSVYRRASEFGVIHIVIVDECHMIPRASSSRYGTFLRGLRAINPNVVAIGLTATPYRLDSGLLTEGEGALFDGIAYDIDIAGLIADGYLSPVVSKGGIKKIDLKGVRTTAGEYNAKDLERAANDEELVQAAVDEICTLGADRRAWLVYASGIAHAQNIAAKIAAHGVGVAVITGKTTSEERDRAITAFKSGNLQCIVNVGVLTKGFNAPNCDLIALMFATKSTAKYVQVVGRGTRLCEGKENCLILDYGGNVMRHGPIDAVNPKKVGGDGTGEAPVKECPNCSTFVPASVAVCPFCGEAFPPRTLKHDKKAFDGEILGSAPTWIEVTDVRYSRHKKPGKPDSVRVTFYAGLSTYNHWLTFDHGGYGAAKACDYSRKAGVAVTSTDAALEECKYWVRPREIKVKMEGKYWSVVGFKF